MLKKLALALSILLVSLGVLAAQTENAAMVVKIKNPVVLNKINNNHATEIFMEIFNTGKTQHTLIGAFSPVAQKIQLHATATTDGKPCHGMNKRCMLQIHGMTLPRHSEEDLRYGGLHIMLIGVKHKLTAKESIPLTLLFSDGSWKQINAKVG